MSFFERYESCCLSKGIKPMSEQAAQLIGVTRATISAWKKYNSTPRTDTIKAIAEAYGISPDYLLGRTEDQTDYTNPDLLAEISGAALDTFDGDVKKAVAAQKAIAEDVRREKETHPILFLYERLDNIDRIKIEAYMQGLLSQDKYIKKKAAL